MSPHLYYLKVPVRQGKNRLLNGLSLCLEHMKYVSSTDVVYLRLIFIQVKNFGKHISGYAVGCTRDGIIPLQLDSLKKTLSMSCSHHLILTLTLL